MALDLNEYIKMSYERPNRKVLEGLGASEGLIEYLMETPGNTNWNVVGSIGESGEGDWTTIRLTKHTIDMDGQEQNVLATTNEEDIEKYKRLCQLYDNGQHPIIHSFLSIDSVIKESLCGCVSFGGLSIYPSVMALFMRDGFIFVSSEDSIEAQQLYGTNILIYFDDGSININNNDYIELRYKISDSYYTILNHANNTSFDIYVEPNLEYKTPIKCTDNFKIYNVDDTIIFNSDFELQDYLTINFYNENHELITGLQYVYGSSTYSYSNPLIIELSRFTEDYYYKYLPNDINNSHYIQNSLWYDNNGNSYTPGTSMLNIVFGNTDFTLVNIN